MAQAADQHTAIRDLGALLRYLTVELGYTKGVAVFMMNERYLDGQLELTKIEYVGVKPQGEVPIDSEFGHLELDRRGVRFVSRIKLWRKVIYRIAEECDVRGIWPRRLPAAQTAPKQRLEHKTGPEASRPDSGAEPSRISPSAIARDAAIRDLLDEGAHPGAGGTVHWGKFCHDVRGRAGGFDGDPKDEKYKRGFSDEHIKRVTRKKMKSWRAGIRGI